MARETDDMSYNDALDWRDRPQIGFQSKRVITPTPDNNDKVHADDREKRLSTKLHVLRYDN
jgi:hypothetical protein